MTRNQQHAECEQVFLLGQLATFRPEIENPQDTCRLPLHRYQSPRCWRRADAETEIKNINFSNGRRRRPNRVKNKTAREKKKKTRERRKPKFSQNGAAALRMMSSAGSETMRKESNKITKQNRMACFSLPSSNSSLEKNRGDFFAYGRKCWTRTSRHFFLYFYKRVFVCFCCWKKKI